ncbi:MAG: acid phosphatase, partial [Bacteroidaceae bacterium]|nr:acid phosphatase [Bacteroidaceae bacterium]
MRKTILSLALLAGFSCSLCAQVSNERDHRTNPDRYYLNYEDVASSLKLLPPPPEVTSIQFLWDDAQYKKGKILRSSARGEQAIKDASPGADSFSEAFGIEINQENTPEIYKL